MTDQDDPSSRGRPAYGEYATPEEQRRRIQRPDLTYLLDTGQDPDAAPGAVDAGGGGSAVQAPGRSARAAHPARDARTLPRGTAAPTRPGRFADRVATIALLIFGLYNVVTSVPAMIDYDSYVATLLSVLGVDGELSNPGSGRGWGIAAAAVLMLGWLATAWLSLRNLSRGRLTWWIPLVAGVVFTFVSGVLLTVPIMTDPQLWETMRDSVL